MHYNVYIDIHIYIYIYVHARHNMYIYTPTQNIYTYEYIYIHMCVLLIHTYTIICLYIYMPSHMQIRLERNDHAYTLPQVWLAAESAATATLPVPHGWQQPNFREEVRDTSGLSDDPLGLLLRCLGFLHFVPCRKI